MHTVPSNFFSPNFLFLALVVVYFDLFLMRTFVYPANSSVWLVVAILNTKSFVQKIRSGTPFRRRKRCMLRKWISKILLISFLKCLKNRSALSAHWFLWTFARPFFLLLNQLRVCVLLAFCIIHNVSQLRRVLIRTEIPADNCWVFFTIYYCSRFWRKIDNKLAAADPRRFLNVYKFVLYEKDTLLLL